MTRTPLFAAAAFACAFGSQTPAADFSDPTWPCIQRKVEGLSVGLMWPHPIDESGPPEAIAEDIADLAQRFALRRLPLPEVQPALDAFVEAHGRDQAVLGQVFAETFTSLSRTRRSIMKGIEDYSLSQIALSERIEAARLEMDTEMAKDAPDYDRVDALEAQLDWDERIYNERRQSLVYVCETPVLLEKRLYEAARMLAAQAEGG